MLLITVIGIFIQDNYYIVFILSRCGNVAAILELDEHLGKNYKIFDAAPAEVRGMPAKKPAPDYFL